MHQITSPRKRKEQKQGYSPCGQPANNVSQRQPPRPRPVTSPRPLNLSDALGTPGALPWGPSRVIGATGPLRYADPPAKAACRVLPVPAARIADRADSMRSCKRSAAASPFLPPSTAKSISKAVAHSRRMTRQWSGSRPDKARSISCDAW